MLFFEKRHFVFLFFLVSFIALSAQGEAISISPADVYVTFVPNHEYVISYSVTSYRPFEFYTEGPFSEYTRIETMHHDDHQGNFKVYLTLPPSYETPGKHRMYVVGKEKESPGAVNTIAAIRGFIEVDVPFPGHYAEMTINVPDVNQGEPVPISVNILNRGKMNISDAKVALKISTADQGTVVKRISSETVPLETGAGYTFNTEIKGGELRPGRYVLEALLTYEGNDKTGSKEFRVGTFDVEITNYTDTMYNNSVNLFEIEVESLWNNRMNTVFMDLSIKDGSKVLSTVKTPPFDLLPWQKRKTSFYWNTEGIDVGEYDLEIVLHYDEDVKTENRKIYIVDRPIEEQPLDIPVTTVLLVIIAIILVGFNIYFIFGKRRKDDEDDKKGRKKSV